MPAIQGKEILSDDVFKRFNELIGLTDKYLGQINTLMKNARELNKALTGTNAKKYNAAIKESEKNTSDLSAQQKILEKTTRDLGRTVAKTQSVQSQQGRDLIREKTRLGEETRKVREEMKKELGIQKRSGKMWGTISRQVLSAGAALVGVQAILRGVFRTIKDGIAVNREFEKSFTNVITLLDEADKKKFGAILERGAIDIVAEFGLEIEDVNKALFDAISAGIPAAEAIDFLRESAVLAVGGVTNLGTAVGGTAAIMNAYGLEADEVEQVTSALFSAQKKGVTTVEQLSNSIGKTAPIAKQAGVSYKELLTVFAELTKQGISTDETATAIKATLTALLKPTEQAEAAFESWGIETGATALQQNGLFKTLQQVSSAAEQDADSLAELIPNVRALTGVGALGTEQLAEMDEILKILETDFGESSSLIEGFNEQMATGQKVSEIMKGEWKRLMVEVGSGSKGFKKAGGIISVALASMTKRMRKTREEGSILAGVGKIFGQAWTKQFKVIGIGIRKFLIEPMKLFGNVAKAVMERRFGEIGGIIKGFKESQKTLTEEFNVLWEDASKKVSEGFQGTGKVVVETEEEITEKTEDETEKRLAIRKREDEKILAIRRRNAKLALEIRKLQGDDEHKLTLDQIEFERETRLAAAKKTGEEIFLINQMADTKRLNEIRRFNAEKNKIAEEQIEKERKRAEEDAEFFAKKQADQEAGDQLLEDQKLEKREAIAAESANLINGLADLSAAINDREIAQLEDKLNKGLISEEKFDKEVAKIKRRQAIVDKTAAITTATINTFVAVSKAFAQTGALGFIPAALILATGLANVATIAAQPIPAFEKGGKKKESGFARVSERRQELGILPDGSMFATPSEESTMWLPKDTIIKPDLSREIDSMMTYTGQMINNEPVKMPDKIDFYIHDDDGIRQRKQFRLNKYTRVPN